MRLAAIVGLVSTWLWLGSLPVLAQTHAPSAEQGFAQLTHDEVQRQQLSFSAAGPTSSLPRAADAMAKKPIAQGEMCAPVSDGNDACRVPRLWIAAESLLWWIRDSHTPALVATSPATSLPILGRPGTVVLFGGDIDHELRSGARFTLGGALDCLGHCQGEISGFFLADRSIDFAAASNGNPSLSRPFLSALTGREAAEQVANPALPGVLPLTGRVTASLSSRLWGVESNLSHCLGEPSCGWKLSLLAGFRYVDLDEGLLVTEDLRVPGFSSEFAGTRFQLRDDFETGNDFYGGQFGARLKWSRGPWSLDVLGKVALGCTHQSAAVRGATLITAPGEAPEAFVGALLAQRTNIGDYERNRFAVAPEIAVNAGWQATNHLRVMLGYNFLYLSSVVRPGDQIDRVVDPRQLPPGSFPGSTRPGFQFRDTDFWAQGISLGLEFTY